MRCSRLILAASSCQLARAGWLAWTGDRELANIAVETAKASAVVVVGKKATSQAQTGQTGWTPKPTPPPGFMSEQEEVLELLRRDGYDRRQASANTWLDSITCGWTSGISSAPLTCNPSSTCSTNGLNVVACVSGSFTPFFTVCLDHQAFLAGKCSSIGPQTGCCQSPQFGACGTLLWTASPTKSMYRCFSSPTIIRINDVPQFVIDASTRTTSTSRSSSSSSTSGPATTTTGGGGGNNDSSSTSSNTGAIVGGVVGGVAVLAITASLITWMVLRKRKAGAAGGGGGGGGTTNNNGQMYGAVPASDPSSHSQTQTPAQLHAQMAHALHGGPPPPPDMVQSGYAQHNPGATTFPPMSPYPGNSQAAAASYAATLGSAPSPTAAYDPHRGSSFYASSDYKLTAGAAPGSPGFAPSFGGGGGGAYQGSTPSPGIDPGGDVGLMEHQQQQARHQQQHYQQAPAEMGSENYLR